MSIDRLFKDPKPVFIESLHPSVIRAFLQEASKYEGEVLFLSNGVHPRPLLAIKRLIITILYEEGITLEEWGHRFPGGKSSEEFIRFCRTQLGIESPNDDYYVTVPGILKKARWDLLFDNLRPAFETKRFLVIPDWDRLDPLSRFFITAFAADFPLKPVIFSHRQPSFEYQSYMPEVKTPEISSHRSFLYDLFGTALPAALFGPSSQASAGLKYGPFLLFLERGEDVTGEEHLRLLHTAGEETKGYFDWTDRYRLGKPSMEPEDEILYLEEMKKKITGTMNINGAIFINETLARLYPRGLLRLRLYLEEIFPLYDAVQEWEKGAESVRSFSQEALPEREKTHLRYYEALFSVKGGGDADITELDGLAALALQKKWSREYYDILSLLTYLAYMSSDYDKAEHYAETLLRASLLPRNPDRDIEALNILGFIRENKSEWEKAYDFLKEARDMAVEQRLPLKEVMMNANIGLFFTYTKDYPRAVDFLNDALYGALRADVKMVVGNVYGNLGIVYADQDDMDRSLDCYEKALRIFKEIGYRRGIYIAQDYMAFNYYKMKDDKSALLYYATLEKMLGDWGEKRLLARSRANFARVYLHLKGNGERADFYLTRSIKAEQDMGVQEWQWDIPVLIDARLLTGDVEKAREAFRELEPLYKRKKLPETLWKQLDLRQKEMDAREGKKGVREKILQSLKGLSREENDFWEHQFLLDQLFDAPTVSRQELLNYYQSQSSPEASFRLTLLEKRTQT